MISIRKIETGGRVVSFSDQFERSSQTSVSHACLDFKKAIDYTGSDTTFVILQHYVSSKGVMRCF